MNLVGTEWIPLTLHGQSCSIPESDPNQIEKSHYIVFAFAEVWA